MKTPKIFSSLLSGFNVTSKKKKNDHCADESIFFRFYVDLQKKKKAASSEFSKFSLRYVRHRRERHGKPQLSMVLGGKQKRRNSQNFRAKMPEKILHFFALIGNTAYDVRCDCNRWQVTIVTIGVAKLFDWGAQTTNYMQ